jgi:hypothetical protein
MVRPSTAALVLGLLALPLLRPAAQETDSREPVAGEETRRLLLCFELAPDANFSQEEELLLYESLLVQLGSASRKVAVLETSGRKPGASDADRSTLARSLGGDSWLRVGLSGDWTLVNVAASSYDLLTGQTVFDLQMSKSLLRGAADLERGFWTEVLQAAAGYYSQAAAAKTLPGEVVFLAPPGTLIAVAGREDLRADTDGQASLSVQLPLTLSIRATRPGFYPMESKYYVSQELTTLELAPARGARFAFDVYLNNAIFPGFEFSWFPLPNTLFLRAGFTTYLAGLFFSGDYENTSLFVSETLNLLDLGFGSYLNDADRHLRVYAGLGAFLRLITSLGYFGLEPIAPWGLQTFLGLEYSRRLKQRFYLELAPLLYVTDRPDLLKASFPPNTRRAGYLFLDKAAVSFLNLRFGFRWQI